MEHMTVKNQDEVAPTSPCGSLSSSLLRTNSSITFKKIFTLFPDTTKLPIKSSAHVRFFSKSGNGNLSTYELRSK